MTSPSSLTGRWCVARPAGRQTAGARRRPGGDSGPAVACSPYDWDLITASVRKTNRVLVLHEDNLSFGYGAEIAARIAEELFEYLDAPVRRLAAKDVYVPYHPRLEDAVLPQVGDIQQAARELASY